jgi:hypothetical protein
MLRACEKNGKELQPGTSRQVLDGNRKTSSAISKLLRRKMVVLRVLL